MAGADVRLTKLGQIAVRVRDVGKAAEFYRDVLRMPFLFQFPGLAFFDLEGVRLMLGVAESPETDHPASPLYFPVDGINEAVETLRDRGVSFDDEPHIVHQDDGMELWMAFFRDPDGNVLALMEERRK